MKTLQELSEELDDICQDNGLPALSPEELIGYLEYSQDTYPNYKDLIASLEVFLEDYEEAKEEQEGIDERIPLDKVFPM